MKSERKGKKHVLRRILSVAFAITLLLVLGLSVIVYTQFETEVDVSLFGMQIADSTTRFYYCDSGVDHRYD